MRLLVLGMAVLLAGCGSVGVDPLWGPVSIAAGSATAAALGPVGFLVGAAVGAAVTFAGLFATTPAAQPGGPPPPPGIPTWILVLAVLPVTLFLLKLALGPRFRSLLAQAIKSLTRLDIRGSFRALWQASGAAHSRPGSSSQGSHLSPSRASSES